MDIIDIIYFQICKWTPMTYEPCVTSADCPGRYQHWISPASKTSAYLRLPARIPKVMQHLLAKSTWIYHKSDVNCTFNYWVFASARFQCTPHANPKPRVGRCSSAECLVLQHMTPWLSWNCSKDFFPQFSPKTFEDLKIRMWAMKPVQLCLIIPPLKSQTVKYKHQSPGM